MAEPYPQDLFDQIDACWVCGSPNLRPANEEQITFDNFKEDPRLWPILSRYHGYQFRLNQCDQCGFMQPNVLPSHPQFFDSIYNLNWSPSWMESEFTIGYKDLIFGTVLRELARRVAVPARTLLDVGAHVGRMLHLAWEAGWQAEGIELNPQTAKFAAERTGLPIHQMSAQDVVQTGSRYDAVVLTDVLEHIPDPVATLGDLRNLLKPGGWIAVKVPCGGSQLLKQRIRFRLSKRHDPGIATNFVHVNHFGPRSLKAAFVRSGFDSIRIGIGAPELPPESGLKGASTRAFRIGVYQSARFLPLGVHSPLALNLQAYARNPAS